MSEIVAIVEGETEQTFVRSQLAEHLGARGIAIWAVLPGRTRRQGGVKAWESARGDILRTLKEGRYCTTMFDYYAMPRDWPGRDRAASAPWGDRAATVEKALLEEVSKTLGPSFDPAQFLPYVQLHEFEALLFSDTTELAAVTAAVCGRTAPQLRAAFDQIVANAGGCPEAIDDGVETCPSRRIGALVQGFRKRLHSPIVAQRIGLDTLGAGCPHFYDWVTRLEQCGRRMSVSEPRVAATPPPPETERPSA